MRRKVQADHLTIQRRRAQRPDTRLDDQTGLDSSCLVELEWSGTSANPINWLSLLGLGTRHWSTTAYSKNRVLQGLHIQGGQSTYLHETRTSTSSLASKLNGPEEKYQPRPAQMA